MAETLVQKIKNNAGKQWSRNTVADGNWLNSNTIQKFNENDITLANAIQEVSAAMEHFTPEITPSAWPCAANKTIQNIEQNADGSLNVTYQPIDSSTTSNESLWSWYKHNAYDSVLAVYTEPEEDINHEAGELSESLTIPKGIYDVKIEVLYQPTQSTINNKLDFAISPTTNIEDALYQTFILFDDTLNHDNDVQSQWITGIIDLTGSESTTLKFLIKGETAQGRYKLNNIYINSIGGAAGPEGPEGPAGPQGPTGPQGIGLSADSSESEYGHYVEIWKQGASQYDTRFEVRDGEDGQNGKSLSAEYVEDSVNRQTQVKIGQIDGAEQTSFNLPWGVDGHTPEIEIDPSTKEWMIDDVSTGVKAEGEDGQNGDPGENGTSVIVKSIREFNDTVGTHTKGGTEITLEWNEGQTVKTSAFSAFNGEKGQDGSGASYTFDNTTLSGTGAIDDPIGVKTNVIATQAWVEDQGYLTTIPDTYATKDYANTASANALTQAQSWVGQQGFITKDVNDLTNYYKKSETSAAAELTTEFANKVDIPINLENKYLALRTNLDGTVSGWTNILDKVHSKSEADLRYVQKSDIKTGTYGNITEVSAIGNVPIKDTKFWAINEIYESNNNYQHYIENTNTFNYYTVMVHPSNTTSAASWANDNIIHIILE